MDELSTLVQALEGDSQAIGAWGNRNFGVVSANAEDADMYKPNVERDMCKTKCNEEVKSSNSDVLCHPNSHVSSELVHSESISETSGAAYGTVDCHNDKMNNKKLDMDNEAMVQPAGPMDLNIDVMSSEHEINLLHIAGNHDNKGVSHVEKVCYSEANKEQDNMELDAVGVLSDPVVLKKVFSPCSRDLQNSCSLDGYKLFGVDLQTKSDSGEQLNSVLKTGAADTTNTSVSLTKGRFLIDECGASVEPVCLGSVVHGKMWCSKHAIYPKGFKSRVKFFSILDPARICYYVSEVSDAGFLGPLFKVTMEEHPSEAITNTSADNCWEKVLDRLNHEIKRRRSLGELELPPLELLQSINGHKMFGFHTPSVIQAIEAQDPNHQCVDYWNHKETVAESSGSGNDDSKFINGSSNSLGDIKGKIFGFVSIKQEQDDIGGSFQSFEVVKSLLQGFLKKASPDELSAMHKLFSSDEQVAQWRPAFTELIEEI